MDDMTERQPSMSYATPASYEEIGIDRIVERARLAKDAGMRIVQICGTATPDGVEVLYSFDSSDGIVNLICNVADDATIPSITGAHPEAFFFENELQDLFGLTVSGLSVDYGGRFYNIPKKAPFNPRIAGEDASAPDAPEREPLGPEAQISTIDSQGKRTVLPFGPQHPVLPEPLHLDLAIEDEKVVSAIPQLGFVHRGLEKLVQKRDFKTFVYIAERICGICSFGHSYAYVQAAEQLMGVEIPPRAEYLRGIFMELSRIHSHLLWLGLCADAFGFENLFQRCWLLRERVLDVFETYVGARVILSMCVVGGVHQDIDDSELAGVVEMLKGLLSDYERLAGAFLGDTAVRSRLAGVGVLTKQQATDLACVGPFARGSGVEWDVRMLGIGAYGELASFEPALSEKCDALGRVEVRVAEVRQSVRIIEELASKIPGGGVRERVKGRPADGSRVEVRMEQPRGEAFYMLKGNGTQFLERFRVRTPTSQNVAGLLKTLEGCDLADVPINVLSIDPCISCAER